MKTTIEQKKKRAEYMKKWNKLNPEKAKQNRKNTLAKYPERYKEIQKQKYLRWKKEKPEQLKTMQKKAAKKYALKKTWLLPEKKEASKVRAREWRLKHPGETTKRVAAWRKVHPEETKLNRREWAKKNPEKNRISRINNEAKRRQALGKFTAKEWRDKKKEFNHICPACKQSEPTIKLSVDHINPLILGGSNYIENIQPLCMPCNSRKNDKCIRYLPISVVQLII